MLNYPAFYKPNPNDPQVYDAQGNKISLDQYKQATGQQTTPDNQVNFQYVQSSQIPTQVDSASVWNLPGMAALKATLSPGDQAFTEALYKTTQGQIAAGGVGTVDANSMNKALEIASTDPSIQATYGDAAKEAGQQLAFNLQQLTNNQDIGQKVLGEQQLQARKDLADQYAQAGQAYSGFRNRAQQSLQDSQNQIIQSSRSQIQQQLQGLGSDYESKFGSAALAGQPGLSYTGQLTGTQGYNPLTGIIGTNTQGQREAEQTLAQNQGILPSVSSTGVLK